MSAASGPPFRAEVIGSLLRPSELKQASRAVQQGGLDREQYEALLDSEIARAIGRQRDIGLRVVTDGEFARSSWFGFFFEGMQGFRLEPSHFKFKDADGREFEWPTCFAEARIRRRAPITLGEFERARRHAASATVKTTMPAPSAFHFFRMAQVADSAAYPDLNTYFADLVAVYRMELAELSRAGCRYVQLDEVPIAMLCDPQVREQSSAQGCHPGPLLDRYIAAINQISAHATDMMVGMHLCRGNFRGRWMAAGGYEPVAEKLFNSAAIDAFCLEYDSERAGDFRPLRHVPKGKRIVLGLLSSKSPVLEDTGALLRRIEDAARYVPLDQLSLSTQCGFASVAGGNALTESQQWAKLERVVRVAERVWGHA
jgi:5-methyltetrahydropteroyltriglutamate--homocysteine methyltransferase